MGYTANKRRALRVPAGGLDAMFLFESQIGSAWVLDISMGGALLRTATGPPVGADTEITFSDGRRNVIRATARVVHRNRHDKSLRVCFVRLRDGHKDRLRHLVMDCSIERLRDMRS